MNGNKTVWMMLVLVFAVAPLVSSTNFQTNLTYYWDFDDERDGNPQGYDSINGNHMTSIIGNSSVGFINESWAMGGIEYGIAMSQKPNLSNASFTFSVWVNHTDAVEINKIFEVYYAGGTRQQATFFHSSAGATYYMAFASDDLAVTYPMDIGVWQHEVWMFDAQTNNQSIWINGSMIGSRISAGPVQSAASPWYFNIGGTHTATNQRFQGNMDEMYFWVNRSFTGAEILQIYNEGMSGNTLISPPGTNSTVVSLNAPADNLISNNYTGDMVFTYTSLFVGGGGSNCSLWTNETGSWSAHGFDYNPQNNTVQGILDNVSNLDVEGKIVWNVQCCHLDSTCAFGINRTLNIDKTVPGITVIDTSFFSTTNSTILTSHSTEKAFYNLTFTDDRDLFGYEILITRQDGFLSFNITSVSLSGTNETIQAYANITGGTGNYTINMTIWDSHTTKTIPDYYVIEGQDYILFDNKIKVTAQGAKTSKANKNVDRYEFEFDYDSSDEDKTYYLESDGELAYLKDSEYTAHFVDWTNKRWIDFVGLDNPVVEKINSKKYKVSFKTKDKKVKFSSIGGLNSFSQSYSFQVLGPASLEWVIPSINKSISLLENNSIFLSLNVTGSFRNLTTFFIYNSTALIRNNSVQNRGNGSWLYNTTFYDLSPSVYTFYINATHVDEQNNTAISEILTLHRVSITNCSNSNATLVKFSVYNEKNIAQKLNSTAEVEMQVWLPGEDSRKNFTFKYEGNSSYQICLLPQINLTLRGDLYIKYTPDDLGFTHRYYLFNSTFLQNETQTLSIYNFNTTTGISNLKMTLRSKLDYSYINNVVGKLQRFYVSEGVWRTVQMDKSGDFGVLFFNILEESTDYRILFMNTHNAIIEQTNSMKFVCDGAICDITKMLDPTAARATATNLAYSWSYNNESQNITVTWSDTLGGTSSVRILVTKEWAGRTSTLCNVEQNASAGTIVCNVAGQEGSVLLRVFSSASDERPIISVWIEILRKGLQSIIGNQEGAFWAMGITLTTAMFGAMISPVGALIGTILGLIIGMFFGLFSALTITFVIIAGMMAAVLSWRIKK